METFKEFLDLPYIDQVIISGDGVTCQVLEERKWIDGRFKRTSGSTLRPRAAVWSILTFWAAEVRSY